MLESEISVLSSERSRKSIEDTMKIDRKYYSGFAGTGYAEVNRCIERTQAEKKVAFNIAGKCFRIKPNPAEKQE